MTRIDLDYTICCWNCQYSHDAKESFEKTGSPQATTSNYLLCKRYPPTAVQGREHFPQVAIREQCGEWRYAMHTASKKKPVGEE